MASLLAINNTHPVTAGHLQMGAGPGLSGILPEARTVWFLLLFKNKNKAGLGGERL